MVEATPGELVIVTGMTGAGRSTAAKELEDLGYFVVDNLPPTLVRDVVRLVDDSRGIDQPIAVVVDVPMPISAAATSIFARTVSPSRARVMRAWAPGIR